MKTVFLILLIAGILFQSTIIFLPASIQRDEGTDQRLLIGPRFHIPPFFQKDILSHSSILKGNFRLRTTYHLWPVAIAYSIFKPSRMIYRFFMFIYIMLFMFSFYSLIRLWFNREITYIATIFAVFSSAIANLWEIFHITSIAFTYFAIYFMETRRQKRPFLACFLLALSAYGYSTARFVIFAYAVVFCWLRWDECRKNAYPYLLFIPLMAPLIVITYFCPQEIPAAFFCSFADFLKKAKYAFWYRIEIDEINRVFGQIVVNPVLSAGTVIYLSLACAKFIKFKFARWKKCYGRIFFFTLILVLFIFIYMSPYVQSRLVVWALPSFYVFTAFLLYEISRKIIRWKYYTFVLIPCLLFYIGTEVPPHIRKITHPTIHGLYCYGADKILPYLLKENPKKLFVDKYMSNILLLYSREKLNIDRLQYYQLNNSTFPWDIGSSFKDEAYFVFWADNHAYHINEFFRIAEKNKWTYTLKKEFDFPEHRSGIKIYKVKQGRAARY